jgi:hypothetical protein
MAVPGQRSSGLDVTDSSRRRADFYGNTDVSFVNPIYVMDSPEVVTSAATLALECVRE